MSPSPFSPRDMKPFPFDRLPAELCFEIVRFAALPKIEYPQSNTKRQSYYATAVSLCSVSFAVRHAAMPHLLHTVILTSDINTQRFVRAIVIQRSMRKKRSRLALDYTRLVRRLWCTECYNQEICNDTGMVGRFDYTPLYDITRGVQSLAICCQSQDLLCAAIASLDNPVEDWTCRRLTFAGGFWRWNPLISAPEGRAFLRRITHLVLWIDGFCGSGHPAADCGIRQYLKRVPLHLMLSLTHFEFAIMCQCEPIHKPDPEAWRRSIVERNPSCEDIVKHIDIRLVMMKSSERMWELTYLQRGD